MKILGISCSPRTNGNTDILIREALKGATEEGAEKIFLPLRELNISPCNGCNSCVTKKKGCCIKDDMEKVAELMELSRGIIIGSPIYFWSVCAQAKAMIDRTYALRYPKMLLANKVGGAIVVASRRGCINASGMLNYWMISNHMMPSDVVDGYAAKKGAIKKDTHAMKASFELGRLVAKLIAKEFVYPEEFNLPIFTFTEKKYKVNLCPIT